MITLLEYQEEELTLKIYIFIVFLCRKYFKMVVCGISFWKFILVFLFAGHLEPVLGL